jgi:CheY-like chemotaxis protein
LPRKILLADDSVTAQNMGRKILTEAGYEVITVNNGAAAMKKISEAKPDLVVLDVHMPGYGGLELCQRLRETPRFSRIPVLLTVGKLEPFRADDARRVKADAFVIKPFEASELLAVLTGLEDKIVPAMPDFGDDDKDWRVRLRIPAPYMKRGKRHEERADESVPAPAEKTALASEAAADQVAGVPAVAVSEPVFQEATGEKPAAAGVSTAAQFVDERTQGAAPVHVDVETATAPILPAVVEESAPSASVAPAREASTSNAASSVPAAESTAVDEVSAALASLAPVGGDTTTVQSPDVQPAEGVSKNSSGDEAIGEAETFAGPRWIAEEVAVTEEESAVALDLEMQRGYVSFAAADAARFANYGSVSSEPAPTEPQTASPTQTIVYDAEVADQVAAYFEGREDLVCSQIAAATIADEEIAKTEIVAGDITQSDANEEDSGKPDSSVDGTVAPDAEEKAAYAVAGADGVPVGLGAAVESSETSQTTGVDGPSPLHLAELATAWEQWKQVRDCTVNPELAPIAEASATHSETVTQTIQTDIPKDADEAAEIASIVDSVLADLKPKLMAEIARKIGKGKK